MPAVKFSSCSGPQWTRPLRTGLHTPPPPPQELGIREMKDALKVRRRPRNSLPFESQSNTSINHSVSTGQSVNQGESTTHSKSAAKGRTTTPPTTTKATTNYRLTVAIRGNWCLRAVPDNLVLVKLRLGPTQHRPQHLAFTITAHCRAHANLRATTQQPTIDMPLHDYSLVPSPQT